MPYILLAEADRDLRDAYHRYLSRHGFEVQTADNGFACLTMLRQCVPDLLVLDIELPWGGWDGILCLMRNHPRLSSVPVLLTSAVASPQQLDTFVSPPVIKALAKPFPLAALLEHGADVGSVPGEPLTDGTDRLEVLVVDDEPLVRQLLRNRLEQIGFPVWTADNGEQALDLVEDHGQRIGAVILDMQLPDLECPFILEGIHAFDPQKPVYVMTGDPGHSERDDLRRQGARHVFQKPFRIDEVVRIVRGLASETMGQLQVNWQPDQPTQRAVAPFMVAQANEVV